MLSGETRPRQFFAAKIRCAINSDANAVPLVRIDVRRRVYAAAGSSVRLFCSGSTGTVCTQSVGPLQFPTLQIRPTTERHVIVLAYRH